VLQAFGKAQKQIDDSKTSISELIVQNKLSYAIAAAVTASGLMLLSKPEGFNWAGKPINVYKNAAGIGSTDFDGANYKPNIGSTQYHLAKSDAGGSDSNDGLTASTPLATYTALQSKPDIGEIVIHHGYFSDSDGFNGMTHTKDVRIVAAPGEDVTISTFRTLTWSKTAGRTNVYESSRTLVVAVWDASILDGDKNYTKLNFVASLDLCDSTAGSYFYSSPNIYVHTLDGRPADLNIKIALNVKNYYNVGNHITYFENLKLFGGIDGAAKPMNSNATDSTLFIAKNCQFKYSTGGNGGVSAIGAECIIQNCIASKNYADGFNYHAGGRALNNIEINGIAKLNGISLTNSQNNASTIHESGKIIRINTLGANTEGPVIHDVDSGTQSWNIGCNAYDSDAVAALRNVSYMAEDGAEMWLDACFESLSNYSLRADTGGKIHLRACSMAGVPYINGGMIDLY